MSPTVASSVASEIVRLLLIVVFVPSIIAVVRRLRFPGRMWLVAGVVITALNLIASFYERFAVGNPTIPARQWAIAATGAAFAIGIWRLLLAMRRREVL